MMRISGQPIVHDTMHMRCCGKPMVGKILWIIGFISFAGGVIAFWQGGEWWGVSVMTWYWTALVAGVLAMGPKAKHGWCGCGTCSGLTNATPKQ